MAQFDALLVILEPHIKKKTTNFCELGVQGSIYSALCCETKWMNLTISLFHKNWKWRQRRVKLVPLQVCAYYISVPFSQIMLLIFSVLSVFPSYCYIIYKEITFDLFVTYMATGTADSWDNVLNIALDSFYSPSPGKVPFLNSLWSPVHLSVLTQFTQSFSSNHHIMINYFKMTTYDQMHIFPRIH